MLPRRRASAEGKEEMNREIPLIRKWIESKRDENDLLRNPVSLTRISKKSKRAQAVNAKLICQAERMIIEKINV